MMRNTLTTIMSLDSCSSQIAVQAQQILRMYDQILLATLPQLGAIHTAIVFRTRLRPA